MVDYWVAVKRYELGLHVQNWGWKVELMKFM